MEWFEHHRNWLQHHWEMWPVMGFVWLLLLIAILAGMVWFARSETFRPRSGGPFPQPPGDSAEEILRRRFAQGEIDEDEFHRRLEALRR